MFSIIIWTIFGFIAGTLAKFIHPGDEPIGFIPTIFIGILGSYIGGLINWIFELGKVSFEPSGIFMSIVGGVCFCALWRFYKLKSSKDGPRSFINGKNMNG